MLLHPHARCGLGPSHLQHRTHAGALQLPSWQRHTRHATAAGSRSWLFPRQARGVPARTAITSADSGVSIGSEDAAVAVGPPRQGAEHEQADLSVAASSSMLALSEPAGIMFYGVNGAHEHVRVSHAEPYPAGAASTSSPAQQLPANGSRTPLGLGTASFAVPIQSWGGDDEPHAAQSAAARAAVEAATAAKAATAAEAAAQQAAAAAAAAAAAVQRSQSGSDAQSGASSSSSGSPDAAPKKAGGSMGTRIVFGALLGVGGAAAVAIKQLFLVVLSFITFHATQEYYAMVSSKGITRGMAAPPRIVSALTTVLCVSMVMFSYFYRGRSGTVLAVAAFFLLVMNMVAIRKPKFSQLASTLFGVFYCGWLPSFWVKLRFLAIAAPKTALLPGLLGIPAAAWTVGLVATFTSAICVVAADTGAYFVGKTLGRTKLTDISPKKTVEGAIGGLVSSVGAAVALWKLTSWPATPLAAAGLGVLTFFSSLFGDLIESIIKRDAGMKDSGDLIPGHGGLLDRFDSYMFTGAVTYFYILFILPYFPF